MPDKSVSDDPKDTYSIELRVEPSKGDDGITVTEPAASEEANGFTAPQYRLHRRRFVGCAALFALNIGAGMNWAWFTAMATETSAAFDISLAKVNWLANCYNLIYIPVSCLIPVVCRKYGIRLSCLCASVSLLLGSWLKYAGAKTTSSSGAYALLLVGQIFGAISQPIFQVLGPKFSEQYFDLKSRTTATMLLSLGSPIGTAIGQALPPGLSNPRDSLLVGAIATTVITASSVLIGDKPPTPPTYAGSKPSPHIRDTLRALFTSQATDTDFDNVPYTITTREKADFAIISFGFSILAGNAIGFTMLISQIFEPHGYSSDASGFFGAALFLAGLLTAIATAPLFDRVLSRRVKLTLRTTVPVIAVLWLGLIWAVKPHDYAGIYVLMVLIGAVSFMLMPIVLELACDLSRNAEASSALLWTGANIIAFIYVIVADPLRAGAAANPPYNLRSMLIFMAVMAMVLIPLIYLLEGKRPRRDLDEEHM